MLSSWMQSLCYMQGRLFCLSSEKGYESSNFVKTFMTSDTVKDLDKPFNFTQWAGEKYLLSRLEEENGLSLVKGETVNGEVLYWCGYLYRAWHFYTGETGKEIYRQAPLPVLNTVYLMYHTMSVKTAIERLKETYQRKKGEK